MVYLSFAVTDAARVPPVMFERQGDASGQFDH